MNGYKDKKNNSKKDVHRAICYHQYERTARVTHWSEHKDVYSTDVLSKQRVRQLLKMDAGTEAFGRYGLETERTLADYWHSAA